MIAFEHGALRGRGEPLLAGILAYGVLETSDAQAISFLAHAERLTVEEWLEILEEARAQRMERRRAVRRLRDTIAMGDPGPIGLMANERISAIARTIEQELQREGREPAGISRFVGAVGTQLKAAAHAILHGDVLGAKHVAQLYAPFETLIPLASLG